MKRILLFSTLFFLLIGSNNIPDTQADFVVVSETVRKGKTFKIVARDKKRGAVDSNNQIVVPIEFEEVSDRPFGFETTRKSRLGLYGYKGKKLLENKYQGIYNPYSYTNKNLINAVDSVNVTLCLIKDDAVLVKLFSFNEKTYRLNCLEHKYFPQVAEGEILFCYYNIARGKIEQVYKLDKSDRWTNVSDDKKLRVAVHEYFTGDEAIPADQK